MGIERTDLWLEEDFDQPNKIIEEHVISSQQADGKNLYNYLRSFGMYSPNKRTKEIFAGLKKQHYWSKSRQILCQYQKRWGGPDIPVYLFPIQATMKQKMCGVSFKNKMFLFLSPLKDLTELESLIVHEYHHVCRLNQQAKPIHEYSILDSMIMEGLAESAVTNFCGETYNAKWVQQYSDEQLEMFWEKYVKDHLEAKRRDRIHDALMYGKGFFPHLLGYSIGYWLIKKAKEKREIPVRETFSITSDQIMEIIGES